MDTLALRWPTSFRTVVLLPAVVFVYKGLVVEAHAAQHSAHSGQKILISAVELNQACLDQRMC